MLIGPGSPIVAQDYSGLSVAVLGGGDNAFENYVYVRNRARAPCIYMPAACAAAMVQRAGREGVRIGPYRSIPPRAASTAVSTT